MTPTLIFCALSAGLGLLSSAPNTSYPRGEPARLELPSAAIAVLAQVGMAPFAVHVHGLESTLGAGGQTTGRFEWDFGDDDGIYNTLEGFSAAHLYDDPGEYDVTLRVTNEERVSDSVSMTIRVLPDTRRELYVALSGDDGHSGASPDEALKTISRAFELLGDDTQIRLRRGDVFEIAQGQTIEYDRVLISAYGQGERPMLLWKGAPGCSAILAVSSGGVRDTVIEDIAFDSIYDVGALHDVVDAVLPASESTTVRNCVFGRVSNALNCNRSPTGLLAVNNHAEVLGTYFSWAQGTDHVYLGNTVEGSHFEHVIRMGGVNRALIAHNALTNYPKTTIWAMLGEDCMIRGNVLNEGRVRLGPNPYLGSPFERFLRMVFENNIVTRSGGVNATIEVVAGAEEVMIRNNVVRSDCRACISVAGYSEDMERTCSGVDIMNNTGINEDEDGQFVNVGDGAEDVRLINNLYIAPNLVTGKNRNAIVYVEGDDLSSFTAVSGNVWAIPGGFAWVGDGYHYVWPYWSHADGYRNPEEWASLEPVWDDTYEAVVLEDGYMPPEDCVAAVHGSPAGGVFTDYYGKDRPGGGSWSAGAVEASGQAWGDCDLDGDGEVDVMDLLLLIAVWGECEDPPADCAADFDYNGAVDVQDLLYLLARWTM